MFIKILKTITKYSDRNKINYINFLLVLSTLLQYLVYLILPIIAYKITSLTMNKGKTPLFENKNLEIMNNFLDINLYSLLVYTILAVIFANISSILFLKESAFFSFKLASNIQIQMFKNYLSKNYSYFLNNTKSQSINNIITDMFRLPAGIFIPFFQLISASILSILLILTLLFVNFKVSLIVLLLISVIYFLVFKNYKKRLYQTSIDISLSHKKIYEIVGYSLGLNKDVKLYSLENFVNNKFSEMSKTLISTRTFANIISAAPKYIVEGIIISISILIILLLLKYKMFSQETILFFMFFGILSIKIIPALQSLYVCISAIQSNRSLIDYLPSIDKKLSKNFNNSYIFKKSIELKGVSFSYDKERKIFNNMNFKIKKGEKISIIGSNGSGKSTFINLISGLLKPSKGQILCDGKVISQKNLQKIFSILDANPLFMNANIYENISFKDKIKNDDKKLINRLLKLVDLFPKTSKKYYSNNLEAKFSQGEKQKIALARFLFFKREFLIIDEGTTNLSSNLEFKILNRIKKLNPNITIIFITHRFKNLNFFDKIYNLNNGRLISKKLD